MIKRFLLGTILILPFALIAPGQSSAPEDAKSRPNRQEILDLMARASRMPGQQQESELQRIANSQSESKTPRSDFLLCTGLAFGGNPKAQACVANAYENGRGVVEDPSEAYAWYSVAAENKKTDSATQERLEADRQRVKTKLVSAYPHPTDDDLDDLVKAQETRIAQYQSDARKKK
jgi:TPR repeat protein